MVTDSATVTHNGEPIEITIALLNGTIADLRPPLLHKIGVPYGPKIREWPYLRNG